MTNIKPAATFIAIIGAVVVCAVTGLVLTRGISFTRGFHNLPVTDMYAMGTTDEKLYLSIDLDPAESHLKSIRVALQDISLNVNPEIASDLTVSSSDPYIWGNRWPWVESVTITLKTNAQKEGFEQLLSAEKLKQLQTDINKGMVVGVTHFGLLTSGGRILDY